MTHRGVRAVDPRTAEPIGPQFPDDTIEEVREVARRALQAHERVPLEDSERAAVLRAIAAQLRRARAEVVALADAETALGPDRLAGELERTATQFEAFAAVLADGRHHEAIIDLAAGRDRPDLRRQLVGVGPVAVFGASNFPLAFGVLGGDTASALAAGCPVVAKAHPSHPGTSALCAEIAAHALSRLDAFPNMLQLVHGAHPDVGATLVQAPEIQAVGFTGSLRAGRALHDLAAARPHPIPVYAEMGSLNPAFVLPEATTSPRGDEVATELAASVAQGSGQFCTKPGVIVVPATPHGDHLAQRLVDHLHEQALAPLLNAGVRAHYLAGVDQLAMTTATISTPRGDEQPRGHRVRPVVALTDAATFIDDQRFHDEVFGPAAVLVRAAPDEYVRVAESLPGCLAASVYGDVTPLASEVLGSLANRCGRIVWNAPTTGLAVSAAQNHTGPYPATTAPGHTSVGMTAIRRFQRPVAYQDTPQVLLPPPLQDHNPWGVPRLIDGEWQDGALTARSQ